MNELIKELAEQAGITTNLDTDYFERDMNKWVDYFSEKFAELIIKECVKFCEHESNDDEHDEYDMGMWVKAESIKAAIVEHFGVK